MKVATIEEVDGEVTIETGEYPFSEEDAAQILNLLFYTFTLSIPPQQREQAESKILELFLNEFEARKIEETLWKK